ncbi:hypothetical protein LRP31_06765 [Mesorhizobium mediterraneum]|uniref:hypothetical protein n=1 Tax=Mesorhizobium mediterraneum TaxID=43617 RepID=UPI000FE7BA37|nr:hypothetical protein [Mesorhizobium mediterraneum]RWN41649.1 MAG: hypothetical protein EOR96_12655 [Mesorhizobium sp.]WIW54932.1 hypothetical protein LRP31_06765 [Mesorhizobium mediterraneum]
MGVDAQVSKFACLGALDELGRKCSALRVVGFTTPAAALPPAGLAANLAKASAPNLDLVERLAADAAIASDLRPRSLSKIFVGFAFPLRDFASKHVRFQVLKCFHDHITPSSGPSPKIPRK